MKLHTGRSIPNSAPRRSWFACVAVLLLSLILPLGMTVVAKQSATPEPLGYVAATLYDGDYSDLTLEIDAFWAGVFVTSGIAYGSPNILIVEQVLQTGCGVIIPSMNSYYCVQDRTIYIIPLFLDDLIERVGDYAPIVVLTHEWGHHIQNVLGTKPSTRKAAELQADCLAGAFTRYAEEQGYLEYGDFIEAINTAGKNGDFLPDDDPRVHGTPEERIMALMRGYGGGVDKGCLLPAQQPVPPVSPDASGIGTPESMTSSLGTPVALTPTSIEQYVPTIPPLNHADCFRVEDDGTLDLQQLLERFNGNQEAETRLRTLQWQGSAYRVFACDTPVDGEAGWLEVWVHAFADANGAQGAVDFFAASRSEGSQLMSDAAPPIGDRAMALSGPAFNGQEYTLYASQGPLLVRVTGISPSGIPSSNVLTVAQSVLEVQQTESQPEPAPSPRETARPATAYLPAVPGVSYGECFRVIALGIYAYQDIVSAFSSTRSLSEIDQLGWQDGAYVVFSCPSPPTGRASQLEVIIHRFGDARAAEQAMPVLDAYVPGDNEVQECDTTGSLVVCVTGRSLAGQPLSDVQLVQEQVLTSVG